MKTSESRISIGSPAEIRTPRGVALDRAGQLVVTDFWNSRVVVLDD